MQYKKTEVQVAPTHSNGDMIFKLTVAVLIGSIITSYFIS